jgi:hypothetical protein
MNNFTFQDWTDPITGCVIDAHTAKPRVLARAIRRWVSDCGQHQILLVPTAFDGGAFCCWTNNKLVQRAGTLDAATAWFG